MKKYITFTKNELFLSSFLAKFDIFVRKVKMEVNYAGTQYTHSTRGGHYVTEIAANFSKAKFFNPNDETHLNFLIG